MFATGLLCFAAYQRIPVAATHLLLGGTIVATGLLIYESGVAAGQYGTIFVWAMLIAGYYFPRRVAFTHLAWLLVVNGLVLSQVESAAGYSPLTRWLFTAISLSVVTFLTGALVARRKRAVMIPTWGTS